MLYRTTIQPIGECYDARAKSFRHELWCVEVDREPGT